MVSLPALRAGSATEDFPASAPASWRTGSPATAACSSWRSRWWKPCRAQVADLQSVVILSDPDGLVLHTLGDTQALQRPSAWRWLRQSVE